MNRLNRQYQRSTRLAPWDREHRGMLNRAVPHLLVVVVALTCSTGAWAQEDVRRIPQKRKTPLEAISEFHQKVKNSLFKKDAGENARDLGRDSEGYGYEQGRIPNQERYPGYDDRRPYPPQQQAPYRHEPNYDGGYRQRPVPYDGQRRMEAFQQREMAYRDPRAAQVKYEQPEYRQPEYRQPEYRNSEYPPYPPQERAPRQTAPSSEPYGYSEGIDAQMNRPLTQDPGGYPNVNGYDRGPRQPMMQDHNNQPVEMYPDASRVPPTASYPAEPVQTYQEPMPQQMQPPLQRNDLDYKTGYYQHESQLTQQKLDQQETATQRLIRIQQENDQIKTMYQKMLAENKRLKEQLGEKEQLLKQVETVIEKARQQIKTANVENEELRRQVTKLESDNESQRLASSRQLDAIRKKLDDVLMREISDN